jgi:hypothetical protein
MNNPHAPYLGFFFFSCTDLAAPARLSGTAQRVRVCREVFPRRKQIGLIGVGGCLGFGVASHAANQSRTPSSDPQT